MSLNDIKELISLLEGLSVLFRLKDNGGINLKLQDISGYNKILQSAAKEYGQPFTLSLTQKVATYISNIKSNLTDSQKCIGYIGMCIGLLNDVKDQRDVRKEIIKEVIRPILKSWGFSRKGNNFFKEGNQYSKLFNIQSSSYNTYEEVKFTFNLAIFQGTKTINRKRIGYLKSARDNWYLLTPFINLDELKIQIGSDLEQYVKPYFDKYD